MNPTAEPQPFRPWLEGYLGERTPIGTLATKALAVPGFPPDPSPQEAVAFLRAHAPDLARPMEHATVRYLRESGIRGY